MGRIVPCFGETCVPTVGVSISLLGRPAKAQHVPRDAEHGKIERNLGGGFGRFRRSCKPSYFTFSRSGSVMGPSGKPQRFLILRKELIFLVSAMGIEPMTS